MIKFVLTGFPRTGTTVVSGSIINHPEILFYGEIFSNTPQVRPMEAQRATLSGGWRFEKPLGWGVAPCAYNGSTHPYIDHLFGQQTPFRATGFKVMYDQVRQGPNSDLWDYIAEDRDIRIIRTRRADMLAVVCSFVRANVTHRWHNTGGDMPNPRFIVPPPDFEILVRRFSSMPEQMAGIEATHKVIELDYDRISNDFQGVMDDVYAFIGVKPVEVKPRLSKIARLSPREQLANYDELEAHFRGTDLEVYFP